MRERLEIAQRRVWARWCNYAVRMYWAIASPKYGDTIPEEENAEVTSVLMLDHEA